MACPQNQQVQSKSTVGYRAALSEKLLELTSSRSPMATAITYAQNQWHLLVHEKQPQPRARFVSQSECESGRWAQLKVRFS